MSDPRLFVDLGIVLAAAVLGGVLAHIARQPLIVGYILGGILVNPFTPGPAVSDIHAFEFFAEIGVVLLMFSIGAEFSLSDLLKTRKVALAGAPLGIALITLLTIPIGAALDWPLPQTLVVGAAISVASTMVLLKFLLERGELTSSHGRTVVGITLMEDVLVIALTVVIQAFSTADGAGLDLVGLAIVRAILLLVPILWLARRAVPAFLAGVARTRNPELLLVVTVTIAIGTAALTAGLGLSLALGAFLAGVVIAESASAHAVLDRVLPIRDIFVAVFFVSVGLFINPAVLVAELPTVVALLSLVVLGKFAVWVAVVRFMGNDIRTAVLAGLGLTQIGEFSYILVGVGRASGLVTEAVYNAVLATSLVSILVNALIFRRPSAWLQQWVGRLGREKQTSP